MLLRSASTPILNSWTPHSKESTPGTETLRQIKKHRPVALSASSSSSSLSPLIDGSAKKMTRTLSETDLRGGSAAEKRPRRGFSEIEEESEVVGLEFSIATLQEFSGSVMLEERDSKVGDGGLIGDARVSGGRRLSECSDGSSDCWDTNSDDDYTANSDDDNTALYYQKMIEANPGNSLLLSNYARFLKEVGDYVKAVDYCERAILENPNDGTILSMYADLIWQIQKDASRAENYFDQAIKAAPDDCYVLASYARFLWDAEEDDEGPEEVGEVDFSKEVRPLPAALEAL